MSTSVISATTKIVGNILTITPSEDIEDNCQYEIRLKNFQSLDGKSSLDSYTCKVVTELTPCYCKISDVAVLVDTFQIDESTILYYIREASKYVDYIVDVYGQTTEAEEDSDGVSFPMREFVKTKTIIDCLLKAYVNKAAVGTGIKGKLGEISFEETEKYATSLNDLLDDLYDRLKTWEEALKGYELEGRAAPVYAVKAHKAQSSDSVTVDGIINDITRTLPIS